MASEQAPPFSPDSIPCEIWLSVFSSLSVDASDLCSLSQSCKFFHCLSKSDQIWLVKFQQRWPNLHASLPNAALCNWQALFQRRLRVVKLVVGGLKDLSARFCHSLSLYLSYTSFAYFEQIAQEDVEYGLTFVIDELREILHLPRAVQLTAKFYARQLIRFLIARVLEPELERWARDEGHLETGAILLAQWCQPEIYPKEAEILFFLDSVADATKLKLKESNSHHPLLATSDNHVIGSSSTESLWQPQSCLEILKALNSVFVNDLGFIGNADGYYSLYNSFLNKVIEKRTGIPITLCVLYHAIAQRLGVYAEPVSFPSHFLLKVRISSEVQDDPVYKFIDVFNGCCLMSEDETWTRLRPGVNSERTAEMFQRVAPTQVLKRMLNNITSISNMDDDESASPLVSCSALEMGRVLMPEDAAQKLLLARFYLYRNINLEAVVQLMESIPDAGLEWSLRAQKVHCTALANAKLIQRGIDDSEKPSPKLRSDPQNSKVVFAVGQIMRHKAYHYTCVIYGWDPKCAQSPGWQQQMNVASLPRQDKQPFYNVLVGDGSDRYAAEENLIREPNPVEINNAEVGKYFEEFCGTHYRMNEAKASEYPEDLDATMNYVHANYS